MRNLLLRPVLGATMWYLDKLIEWTDEDRFDIF